MVFAIHVVVYNTWPVAKDRPSNQCDQCCSTEHMVPHFLLISTGIPSVFPALHPCKSYV